MVILNKAGFTLLEIKSCLLRRRQSKRVHQDTIRNFKSNSVKFLTGFTLIEVMIAVAIIAITLVILLHSVGIGIDVSNQSKFISIAPFLAQEKMSEAEASGFWGLNNGSGNFDEEHPDISWETVVTNGPDADLKQIKVKISRGEGKWKSSFELVTYIAKTDEK